VWDHLQPDDLIAKRDPASEGSDLKTGDRVLRRGRVGFVRSGFACVYWDDGCKTTEWAPDLERETP
jgi:hypothetical protein